MTMIVQRAGRMAVEGWMKAARMPLNLATRVLPDRPQGSWARANAELTIDRAEGAVREKVGELLRDSELSADGRRRRIAAHERQRAIALKATAEDERRAADLQLVNEREAAERRRKEAQRTAEQQAASVEREKADQERQARDAAAAQRRSVEQAKAKKFAAADKRAKRQRLEVLDDQLKGLDEEATALTTADEALRLEQAATAAKAARKQTG
jgi:hypothetical protein